MKSILDLPVKLMREFKARATEKNLHLNDFVAGLLRHGPVAASAERPTVRSRIQFPAVKCAHPTRPGDELTPDRVALTLAEGEVSEFCTFRHQRLDGRNGR